MVLSFSPDAHLPEVGDQVVAVGALDWRRTHPMRTSVTNDLSRPDREDIPAMYFVHDRLATTGVVLQGVGAGAMLVGTGVLVMSFVHAIGGDEDAGALGALAGIVLIGGGGITFTVGNVVTIVGGLEAAADLRLVGFEVPNWPGWLGAGLQGAGFLIGLGQFSTASTDPAIGGLSTLCSLGGWGFSLAQWQISHRAGAPYRELSSGPRVRAMPTATRMGDAPVLGLTGTF